MEEVKKSKKKVIVHFPFIEGKTLDLCALNSEHADLYAKWKNDPIVRKYSRKSGCVKSIAFPIEIIFETSTPNAHVS